MLQRKLTVHVTGPRGAGKTTLMRLLSRLLYDTGHAAVKRTRDHLDIRPDELRQQRLDRPLANSEIKKLTPFAVTINEITDETPLDHAAREAVAAFEAFESVVNRPDVKGKAVAKVTAMLENLGRVHEANAKLREALQRRERLLSNVRVQSSARPAICPACQEIVCDADCPQRWAPR